MSWNFVPPFPGERGQGRGLLYCESTQGGAIRKAKINVDNKKEKIVSWFYVRISEALPLLQSPASALGSWYPLLCADMSCLSHRTNNTCFQGLHCLRCSGTRRIPETVCFVVCLGFFPSPVALKSKDCKRGGRYSATPTAKPRALQPC